MINNKYIYTSINKCCYILDSKRIPINEENRYLRKGNIPYYGANGLQGYIDDYIFNEDLILLAEDGGYFDEFQTRPIAYKISGKSWVNNHAHVIKPLEKYNFNYIFYSLEHKNILFYINGGTRSKLNQEELKKIKLIIPQSKEEQERIANILSTCDKVIEKTELTIEKYKNMKQGLMKDLFTRGLDEKGKLRATYKEQPNLYKYSKELKRYIPKDWEITKLKELGEIVSGGTPQTSNEKYWNGSIKFITPNDLSSNTKMYLTDTERYITKQGLLNSSAILLKPKSLVVSSRAPIGYTALCLTEAVTNQGCKSIIFNDNILYPEFYFYNIKYHINELKKFGVGTTFMEISKKDFSLINIPSPKNEETQEQLKISQILQSFDTKIEKEEQSLLKYKQIKQGLMKQLLTPPKDAQIIEEE